MYFARRRDAREASKHLPGGGGHLILNRMKKFLPQLVIVAGAISLACGCSKKETPIAESDKGAEADPAAVVENLKSTAAGLTTKLEEQAKASGDAQLAPIATELTSKVSALGATTAPDSPVRTGLDNTLKSLTGNNDAAALTSVFQLGEAAKLTPEQTVLVKEVGNLASAYVVQKNFSGWTGSQGDVATLVNALRQGQLAEAVPALKNLAASAQLTEAQKQVIIPIADKYAPGWQKLQGTVDTLKKLPGLGN